MSSWDSYPKVWTLGHPRIADLFKGTVLVQEKYDGSQISFGRFGDKLRVRSRGREFDIHAADRIFQPACEQILSMADGLEDGWTYRGEAFFRPKHNVLAYERCPEGHIVLFDICVGPQEYLSDAEVKDEAAHLGLEPAVTMAQWEGSRFDAKTLQGYLRSPSSLGGTQVEGIVIKNYGRFDNQTGKVLMGKLVREEFKERAKQARPKNQKDLIAGIIETYRTEARWQKAVQHLRERGELQQAPQDIGPLIKEVQQDLLEEEGEAIKDLLFKRYWRAIARGVGRGLPEWWKSELLKQQFQGENHE